MCVCAGFWVMHMSEVTHACCTEQRGFYTTEMPARVDQPTSAWYTKIRWRNDVRNRQGSPHCMLPSNVRFLASCNVGTGRSNLDDDLLKTSFSRSLSRTFYLYACPFIRAKTRVKHTVAAIEYSPYIFLFVKAQKPCMLILIMAIFNPISRAVLSDCRH